MEKKAYIFSANGVAYFYAVDEEGPGGEPKGWYACMAYTPTNRLLRWNRKLSMECVFASKVILWDLLLNEGYTVIDRTVPPISPKPPENITTNEMPTTLGEYYVRQNRNAQVQEKQSKAIRQRDDKLASSKKALDNMAFEKYAREMANDADDYLIRLFQDYNYSVDKGESLTIKGMLSQITQQENYNRPPSIKLTIEMESDAMEDGMSLKAGMQYEVTIKLKNGTSQPLGKPNKTPPPPPTLENPQRRHIIRNSKKEK